MSEQSRISDERIQEARARAEQRANDFHMAWLQNPRYVEADSDVHALLAGIDERERELTLVRQENERLNTCIDRAGSLAMRRTSRPAFEELQTGLETRVFDLLDFALICCEQNEFIRKELAALQSDLAALRRPVVHSEVDRVAIFRTEPDELRQHAQHEAHETAASYMRQAAATIESLLFEFDRESASSSKLASLADQYLGRAIEAKHSLDAAQREIQQLKSPPEERGDMGERNEGRKRQRLYYKPYPQHIEDIDLLLTDVARLRNAYDDRVRMLGFVQDELTARNKECVELKASATKLTSDNAEYAKRHLAQLQRIERLEEIVRIVGMRLRYDCTVFGVEPKSLHRIVLYYAETQKVCAVLAAADGQQSGDKP